MIVEKQLVTFYVQVSDRERPKERRSERMGGYKEKESKAICAFAHSTARSVM